MMQEGIALLPVAWWIAIVPGVAVLVLGIGFGLIADSLGSWDVPMTQPLLVVDDLHARVGSAKVLIGVSLRLDPGGALGVVGDGSREEHDRPDRHWAAQADRRTSQPRVR